MSIKTKVRSGAWRSRWAAVGAAVAVTLGAGSMVAVNAASSSPSSFVSINPLVRILDTRTDVGLAGPFVSDVAQKLQVTGNVPTQPPGEAAPINEEVVPATATSVELNVTVVGPQSNGFLSIRPGDATGTPATSNINFGPGGPNIANAVTVQLPASGQIDIFVSGTVREVLIDVAGYNIPVDMSLEARVAALEEAQPVTVTAQKLSESVTATDEVVVSVTVTAPVAGQVTVFSTSALGDTVAGEETRCTITTGIELETGFLQRWESGGPNTGQHAQLSGVRTFDIAAGAIVPYNLVCDHVGPGATNMESTIMSAIFTPGTP